MGALQCLTSLSSGEGGVGRKGLCWAVARHIPVQGWGQNRPLVVKLSPTVQQSNLRSKSKSKPSFDKQQSKSQHVPATEKPNHKEPSVQEQSQGQSHAESKAKALPVDRAYEKQGKGRPGGILEPASKPAVQLPMAHSGVILHAF